MWATIPHTVSPGCVSTRGTQRRIVLMQTQPIPSCPTCVHTERHVVDRAYNDKDQASHVHRQVDHRTASVLAFNYLLLMGMVAGVTFYDSGVDGPAALFVKWKKKGYIILFSRRRSSVSCVGLCPSSQPTVVASRTPRPWSSTVKEFTNPCESNVHYHHYGPQHTDHCWDCDWWM